VRTVDCAPAIDAVSSDTDGCDVLRMPGEAAVVTTEPPAGGTFPWRKIPTTLAWADLTGVRRIDQHEGYARAYGLISDEAALLSERPPLQDASLGPGRPLRGAAPGGGTGSTSDRPYPVQRHLPEHTPLPGDPSRECGSFTAPGYSVAKRIALGRRRRRSHLGRGRRTGFLNRRPAQRHGEPLSDACHPLRGPDTTDSHRRFSTARPHKEEALPRLTTFGASAPKTI
jgi:hypothetical protein